LVAYHEEIVFRRCASEIFGASGNDVFRILASSLLFTAYHWWTGITQMSAMFFFGICMMIFLMRTGAIWPLVLTHYLVDLIWFSVLT
jgi:membrane protease YdiL (CAAX protease family)